MARALLIEVDLVSPVGEAVTLRFTDRAIRPMPPTDALRPNLGFDDRMKEAPAIRRLLFDDITTLLPSLGVGMLTLSNADLELNPYEGYAWGDIGVWLWTEGTASADASLVLKGRCGVPAYPSPASSPAQVKVALYDYSAEGSKALQTTLYAGTNGEGAVLYEGSADALKATPKPLAFGELLAAQIPAPQVNAGLQVFQLNDGPIEGGVLIFDRGDDAGLTGEGDLVGAAFDAATPDPAGFVTDLGRGLVKTNFAPVGQVTFGFKGANAGGYADTAGPIMAQLMARAGIPAGRIGASVAALDAPAKVGFYAGIGVDLETALRFLSVGAMASVAPDREGVWQAVAMGPPAATADLALSVHDVIDCSGDDVARPPVAEIRIGWGRLWQTFSAGELAPDLLGTDNQARLAAEYRWAVDEVDGVKARYPDTWRTITLQTALRAEADALAVAAKLKVMLAPKDDGRPRRLWRVTVTVETALAMALGQTVELDYPPRDLAGNFLLVGEEPLRPSRNQAVWTVWG